MRQHDRRQTRFGPINIAALQIPFWLKRRLCCLPMLVPPLAPLGQGPAFHDFSIFCHKTAFECDVSFSEAGTVPVASAQGHVALSEPTPDSPTAPSSGEFAFENCRCTSTPNPKYDRLPSDA